ncbi:hypothetical protein SAMN04487969_109185 [Paenibacillus algorifonticola]|uniref:Cof subfamily of IIB subfamily of haloacid dehalogenase superfamily/HAD-superfamily hydrolase, subfamily IIB n=1 Tax=Paenibacillus algorifonticola TaxID=684063 RepID=A0A1I2EL53_9BACL|nr:Cof-type HAD-IIB family hydrolase [Paenibacillus algorifonticola]SFE93347.1 hypothetical protein SAMN04487969_109185 [Paenibacillus algorifonticola]
MPNKRSIIFFDIDGTLLGRNKRLVPSAKHAIKALQEEGHLVALASGRSPFMLEALRQELGIQTYVSFNGQYVVHEGEVIFSNPFRRADMEQLSEYARQYRTPLVYLDAATMAASSEQHPYVQTCFSALNYDSPPYDPVFYRERDIYQMMLFDKQKEDDGYKNKFPQLHFVRWHAYSADVLPGGGSKAQGISQLLQKLGAAPEEAYAFGDQLNDLEMLQYIGQSVAMGNAPDEVKQIAKYVTKDVDDDGIAYGLELVGLLSRKRLGA